MSKNFENTDKNDEKPLKYRQNVEKASNTSKNR